ncbi:MAG: bifunctional (p)ppGpp synthetase/guanosine-3',5'-bis(diphosphate) 3'-pyrophosphohydrolase [Chloroflexi bacterium]|nr:bifunctional (p)ppGpp synthetase/guanosine-3',5'-bis(diphosphate) 3'-pyrophosphohydrolase [Chloroflexota bacterium]
MELTTILESLPDYYSPADVELIERAYRVAEQSHRGQKRASGEDYINHCLAVAQILADLRVPAEVVAAGLLHDTVEDTPVKIEDIQRDFGEEIARLVDGVTKLDTLPRVSRSDNGAISVADEAAERAREKSRKAELANETLRKTFLAMGEDVRVVIIKLADRLHNMRTLGYMPDDKRRRIAKQTQEIFAPLASRLGIWQLKWELEDLSFRYSDPETYKEIARSLAERRSQRETQMARIVEQLQDLLEKNGIQSEVSGRPKHIYSIFKKMYRKGVAFDQLHDVRAVRIIVLDVPTCYSVLGLIHIHWRPIPGEFDDYIASPKDNFYQSLHTAVMYEDGKTLEVQIRTVEMHENAEYGIAAHWRYKEGKARDEHYERRVVYLRQLMDWIQDVDDTGDFVDGLKTDVFGDRVYAFTPAGDIIDLPAGATPIDFAYHVHTEVGHRCRGAKVNGKLVALDTVLKTGDKVEILTAKRGGPSRDWLNANLGLVRTNRARSKVRYWFKRQDIEQNVSQGKAQLERELRRLGLGEVNLDKLARDFSFKAAEDLFLAIGIGDINISRVVNYLTISEKTQDDFADLPPYLRDGGKPESVTFGGEGVAVQGLKGLLTTMAKCCNPAPGDEIVGYITRGRGATIHRQDCPNVLRARDRERLVRVTWGEPKTTYPVAVRIQAYDRDGLLRDVSTLISEESINMSQVKVDVKENRAVFDLTLEVGNISQLSRVLSKLENLPNVMEARRVKPG